MQVQNIVENPNFKKAVFVFAVLLILGAWKFGIEGLTE